MKNTRLFGAWVLAASLAAALPAAAQQSKDKAIAESLFQEGIKLFDAGKAEEACPRFEQSQELDPKLSTLLNLALCHEKIGKTATAWAEFNEAATLADKKGEAKRGDLAREHVKTLEGKLSKVKIVHGGEPKEISIVLDGKPLNRAMLGVALPVDPGPHKVEVSATGYVTFKKELAVAPGPIEVPVEVPALEKEKPDSPPAEDPNKKIVDPPVTQPPATPPEKKDEGGGVAVPVGIAVLTFGGVALLTGAITGGVSIAQTSSLEEDCGGTQCGPEFSDRIATANALANSANALIPIGGVAAAVGIAVIVVATRGDDDPKKSALFEVRGFGDVGASFVGHF